ncbi:hypothetical protein [Saprospira grandis]|uniref:Uncharacterized protein n=1 Tax=Saprospira grandis (strain Lewin) TaxID=984262 RepID=H6L742_SAPGL|nr:hypothetical protein [Saprospira grandis]AFC26633.1 hypothetical protein SGRA_3918 [Saprospira grandis str. Lewin]
MNKIIAYPRIPALEERKMEFLGEDVAVVNQEPYKKWFIKALPSRLEIVRRLILRKELDYSYESLYECFSFLKEHLVKRETTEEENLKLKEELPVYYRGSFEPQKYTILSPTYSIAYDIGIYWGEIMIRKFNKQWSIYEDEEAYKYGYPIIDLESKRHNVVFCPIWVMSITATKIAKRNIGLSVFKGFVETWDENFLNA